MSRLLFLSLLFLGLLFVSVTVAHDDDDDTDDILEAQVIKTLNRYLQKLNGLVEYAQGPSCDPATVNYVGISTHANELVDTFFSKQIRGFVSVQRTNGVVGDTVLVNFTVGNAADPIFGAPALTNSSVLHSYLKTFYPLFGGYSFSSPFHWLLSAPVVNIKKNDPAYGRQTTAYVLANNENKGYQCTPTNTGPVREFRLQFNLYSHVFVKEGNNWKYIDFLEENKNLVRINDVTQLEPTYA